MFAFKMTPLHSYSPLPATPCACMHVFFFVSAFFFSPKFTDEDSRARQTTPPSDPSKKISPYKWWFGRVSALGLQGGGAFLPLSKFAGSLEEEGEGEGGRGFNLERLMWSLLILQGTRQRGRGGGKRGCTLKLSCPVFQYWRHYGRARGGGLLQKKSCRRQDVLCINPVVMDILHHSRFQRCFVP